MEIAISCTFHAMLTALERGEADVGCFKKQVLPWSKNMIVKRTLRVARFECAEDDRGFLCSQTRLKIIAMI